MKAIIVFCLLTICQMALGQTYPAVKQDTLNLDVYLITTYKSGKGNCIDDKRYAIPCDKIKLNEIPKLVRDWGKCRFNGVFLLTVDDYLYYAGIISIYKHVKLSDMIGAIIPPVLNSSGSKLIREKNISYKIHRLNGVWIKYSVEEFLPGDSIWQNRYNKSINTASSNNNYNYYTLLSKTIYQEIR